MSFEIGKVDEESNLYFSTSNRNALKFSLVNQANVSHAGVQEKKLMRLFPCFNVHFIIIVSYFKPTVKKPTVLPQAFHTVQGDNDRH